MAVWSDPQRCVAGERYFTYAQVEYKPEPSPIGRPRASNLLISSWEHAGCRAELEPALDRAMGVFGRGHTAWGVKFTETGMSWELYWYRHSLREPLTLAEVARVAPEVASLVGNLDPERRWFSISIDLEATGALGGAGPAPLHLYVTHIGDPGLCTSYGVGPDGVRLENSYYLYAGADMWDRATTWLEESALSPPPEVVLWDEYRDCNHLAMAHKPGRDGVYLGGLNIEQFAGWARRVRLPDWVADEAEAHAEELAHVLIDVGMDVEYRDGDWTFTKLAYFASF